MLRGHVTVVALAIIMATLAVSVHATEPASKPSGATTATTTTTPPSGALPKTARNSDNLPVRPTLIREANAAASPSTLRPDQWKKFVPGKDTEQKRARKYWNEDQVQRDMDSVNEKFDDVVASLSSYRQPMALPPAFVYSLRKGAATQSSLKVRDVFNEVMKGVYRDAKELNRAAKEDAEHVQEHARVWRGALARANKLLKARIDRVAGTWARVESQLAKYGSWANTTTNFTGTVQTHLKKLVSSLEKCPDRVVRGLDGKAIRSLAVFTSIEDNLNALGQTSASFESTKLHVQVWNTTLRSLRNITNNMSVAIQSLETFVKASAAAAAQRDVVLTKIENTEPTRTADLLRRLNAARVGAAGHQVPPLQPLPVPDSSSTKSGSSSSSYIEVEATAVNSTAAKKPTATGATKKTTNSTTKATTTTATATKGTTATKANTTATKKNATTTTATTTTTNATSSTTRKLVPEKEFKPLESNVNQLVKTLTTNLNVLGHLEKPLELSWKDSTDSELRTLLEEAMNASTQARAHRVVIKKQEVAGQQALTRLSTALDNYLTSPVYRRAIHILANLQDLLDANLGRLARVGQIASLRAAEMKNGNVCVDQIINIEDQGKYLLDRRAELEKMLNTVRTAEEDITADYVREYGFQQAIYVDEDDESNAISTLHTLRAGTSRLARALGRFQHSIDDLRQTRAAFLSQLIGA